MRSIFIADAHLHSPSDDNYRMLLAFLRELRGNTDTLFILGDLFEFWIGCRGTPFVHYQPVLDELCQLSAAGTELVFFEGNHDFHMGRYFSETLQARIHRGPAAYSVEGKKVYICHGDQINSKDIGYLLLRFILHNPLMKAIAPLVPARVASAIARRMSRMSKRQHRRRNAKWDYTAIIREFAAARFREGYEVVITGHFHIPLLEEAAEGTGTLLSLGDWITHFTYGEWADGKLTLKAYR